MSFRFVGITATLTALFVVSMVILICYNAITFYDSLQSYNDGLIIKDSNIPGCGNGVFTIKDIKKGTIVEICPIVIDDKSKLLGTKIIDYVFNGDEFGKGKSIIALGYGGMYNHSDDNNCGHDIDKDTMKMIIKAKKDINKGDELYLNYGPDWWKTRNIEKLN